MSKPANEFVLTCASWQQAQGVIDQLFDKHLISRAEIIPLIKDGQQGVEGVKLIMENIEQDLLKVSDEIARLFGSTNFNLQLL